VEEIVQLTILGGGISCCFSSRQATVKRQNYGEFDEFFVQAPTVPLLFCRNIGQMPAFTLDVEFEGFFNQFNQGIQIYEQKAELAKMACNYGPNAIFFAQQQGGEPDFGGCLSCPTCKARQVVRQL